jgi:hypothetical protein
MKEEKTGEYLTWRLENTHPRGAQMKRFLMIALFCGSAHAEFKDGNKLLEQLRGDTTAYIHALGYVIGVYDTLQNLTHCPPVNVTAGQIGDMVKNHLEANPDTRHNTADRIVGLVLKNAWPCAAKPSGRGV